MLAPNPPSERYRMNRRKLESQTPWLFSMETFQTALWMWRFGSTKASIGRQLALNKRAVNAIVSDPEAVRSKLLVQRKVPEGYEHPLKRSARLGREARREALPSVGA